jgi:hypothetical protein
MYKNKYLQRFWIMHRKLMVEIISRETTQGPHASELFFRIQQFTRVVNKKNTL